MRTRVSLLLLLGLLMCGTSALAAESNDNERFPQNQEALSFALTATPAEAETAETEAEIKTATAFNAVETDIPEETDIVSSFEDLQLWLRNLDGYGGEVVLGDTITIEETISPSYNYTGPLSIDTGSFGLIYDGGYIDYCDLFLTGKGVDIPVLEIRNTGNAKIITITILINTEIIDVVLCFTTAASFSQSNIGKIRFEKIPNTVVNIINAAGTSISQTASSIDGFTAIIKNISESI